MSRLLTPFTDIVRGLPASTPFVGPEAIERRRGRAFRARIGANESAFGISPAAIEAMKSEVERLSWYGDPENFDLREALAARLAVSPDEICVDAGIDSLLGLTVRMLVTAGTPVVTSLGAYPTFNYHVAGFGGHLVTVPYRDDREDLDALLDAVKTHRAPLVFLSNPDNPMGTWHESDAVRSFIDALPEPTVLVLDEAYGEFAPPGTRPPIDTGDPRVIRMRTFSKAYGMAGARVGYAVAHRALITGLNKIRNHFAVNRVAQAGALAALGDDEYLAKVTRSAAQGRRRVERLATRLGLESIPSATNFVAVDLGSPERAARMLELLLENDVFVRMPGVAPLNRCVRVGLGRPHEDDLLAEAFEQRMKEMP